MGIICKGACERYKVSKINGIERYNLGLKRCNVCEIFVKWDGMHCLCCGCRLRLRPRNGKYKEKFVAATRQKSMGVVGVSNV